MDHLPRPKDAVLSEFDRVPYVCREEYDGGSFLTYPLRTKKAYVLSGSDDQHYLLNNHVHPATTPELEAFFQTWLFFGLLAEIFGKLFNPTEFVCTVETELGDERILSTAKLPLLANIWIAEVKNAANDGLTRYKHIAKCLDITTYALQQAPVGFDLRIKLSIAAAGEFLGYTANRAFSVESTDNRCPAAWSLFFPDISGLMQGNGWCPREARRCLQTFTSVQTLYYLSKMQKPESQDRHQACTDHECIAYQIQLDNYQTQHYATECTCDEIVIDGKEVIRILQNGQLPLLRINDSGDSINNLFINVLESNSNSRYVALSHVWADGLGNPRANALPRCQLSHLYSLLAVLNDTADSAEEDGELLLWIDTLCCPVEPAEAKTIALTEMRRTYLQATHVLVVDASLQQYRSQDLDAVEACARIFTSGWTQRLWTLQEGALARKLWFQFHDVPVDLYQLWQKIRSVIDLHLDLGRRGLAFNMDYACTGLRNTFYRSSNHSNSDLLTVADALRHRSVSVLSDEPLCIATLMNLDLAKVLAEPKGRRMQELWSLMPVDLRGVPRTIIFHPGPRLREKGYRWAPATLLRPIKHTANVISNEGTVDSIGIPTADGLIVNLPGFLVAPSMPPKGLPENPWNVNSGSNNLLYMRDDDSVWYEVGDMTELLLRNNNPPSPGHLFSGEPLATDKQIQATQRFSLRDLIREKANEHNLLVENSFRASADGLYQAGDALLVKRIRDENGISYVESMLHASVAFPGKSKSEMLEAAYQCGNLLRQDKSTQRLAEMNDDNIGIEVPAYNEELDKLRQKIRDLATEALQDADLMKTASRINGPENANITFQGRLMRFFMGYHGFIATKLPSTQKWCVD